MEIKITNNSGVFIKVKSTKDLSDEKVCQVVKSMIDVMNKVSSDKVIENKVAVKPEEEPKVTAPTQVERPAFRDRLPNTNVVDIEKLTVEQAVTENALVRCPVCGQSHALIVHDKDTVYLMRKNKQKNEFEVVSEGNDEQAVMCPQDESKHLDYFNDLQNAKAITDIKDFAVTNDTVLLCPVCRSDTKFNDWKDAYENPLHYFETEKLCEVCGGEVVRQQKGAKGQPQEPYDVCEKCGHSVKAKGE